jgi:hypothetical protein
MGNFGELVMMNSSELYVLASEEAIKAIPDDGMLSENELEEARKLYASGFIAGIQAPKTQQPMLTPEFRHELVENAVDAIELSMTNRTAAYNVWNNLNTDARFVKAFQAFHTE